ncbi:hypothetical protein K7X08_023163 [Anisodus acutangulus]|uniref:Uncharacterized protein n=1 Tax=Anisodus acutangulus TaxID=402998 RepID=A0A9Q1R137_9SOLA|nr:hypothetical protein K7X08_023163 [Anisodus acutangulus]
METFYFWCSEKSKLLGNELKRKMKDLLEQKPSLAELTGINESRIDCFAIHLRAYLIGSAVTKAQASSMPSTNPSRNGGIGACELGTSVAFQIPQRSRHYCVQAPKSSSLNLGSLSPRARLLGECWTCYIWHSCTIAPKSYLLNHLVPETESVVEKSDRETLRLLINGSNHPSKQLIDVLPSVLSSSEQTQNMLAAESRSFYSGSINVGTIANGFATMGLISLSERSLGRFNERQIATESKVDQVNKRVGSRELAEAFNRC